MPVLAWGCLIWGDLGLPAPELNGRHAVEARRAGR